MDFEVLLRHPGSGVFAVGVAENADLELEDVGKERSCFYSHPLRSDS